MADTLAQVLFNGLVFGGLLAVVSLGLALVFGVMRLVNFLHAEMITLGAYATYFVVANLGWHPLAGLLISFVGGILLGLVTQRVFLDRVVSRPPLDALLLTYGLSITALGVITHLFTGNFRNYPAPLTDGFHLLGVQVSWMGLATLLLCTSLLGMTGLFLRRTRTGFGVRATAQHRAAAAACGVDVRRADLVTYALGSALGAAAGAALSATFTTTPLLGRSWLLDGFVVIVLGGLGSLSGAVVAALGMGVFLAMTGYALGDTWAELLGYLALFGALLLRPQGLTGTQEAA